MTNEDISKLARYIAFLYREADIWLRQKTYHECNLDVLTAKIGAAADICIMLGCKDIVWSEAKKFYDFT